MKRLRMYMDLDALNNSLRGKSTRSKPIGSLRIQTFVGPNDDQPIEEWMNVFLATDRDTQQLKRSASKKLVLNIKPQLQRLNDVLPNEQEIEQEFERPWKDDEKHINK